MHTKLERLLSKSLTTLEVMTHYLVVHTGPGVYTVGCWRLLLPLLIGASDMLVYLRDGSARLLYVLPH